MFGEKMREKMNLYQSIKNTSVVLSSLVMLSGCPGGSPTIDHRVADAPAVSEQQIISLDAGSHYQSEEPNLEADLKDKSSKQSQPSPSYNVKRRVVYLQRAPGDCSLPPDGFEPGVYDAWRKENCLDEIKLEKLNDGGCGSKDKPSKEDTHPQKYENKKLQFSGKGCAPGGCFPPPLNSENYTQEQKLKWYKEWYKEHCPQGPLPPQT